MFLYLVRSFVLFRSVCCFNVFVVFRYFVIPLFIVLCRYSVVLYVCIDFVRAFAFLDAHRYFVR